LLSFDLLEYNLHIGTRIATGLPFLETSLVDGYDGLVIVHIDADGSIGLTRLLFGNTFEQFFLVHFNRNLLIIEILILSRTWNLSILPNAGTALVLTALVGIWRIFVLLNILAGERSGFLRRHHLATLVIHSNSINFISCVLSIVLQRKVPREFLFFGLVGIVCLLLLVKGV
jgi:hypothetical protein